MSARPRAPIAFAAQARSSHPYRLVLVLLAALALMLSALLVAPPQVRAAARSSQLINSLDVHCGPLDNGMGSGWFDAGYFPDAGTPSAIFEHWAAGTIPFEDPLDLDTLSWDTLNITPDTLEFNVHLGLYNQFGVPGPELDVAHVTVSITLGETQVLDTREREGNTWVSRNGTITAVTGTAQVDTGTVGSYSFEDCTGELDNYIESRTNPNAFSLHDVSKSFFCDGLTNADGDFLVVSAFQEPGFEGLTAFIELASGDVLLADVSSLPNLHPQGIRLTFPLTDAVSGEPAGTASLAASMTLVDSESTLQLQAGQWQKLSFDDYAVSGSLTTSSGAQFDLDGCVFSTFSRSLWVKSGGLKVGGPVPSNDTLAGAVAISPGTRLNQQNGGAAKDPEVEGSCAPFTYTLWFKVEGTGSPVTLATAGSNFDTTIAVYTANGNTLTEVACNDDYLPGGDPFLRQLQGQVTFDTEVGTTYYVQIGGFDATLFLQAPQVGRLRLSVN